MRSLQAALLTLVGGATLLGLGSVRVAGHRFPEPGITWLAAVAFVLLLAATRRSSATRLPFSRFLLLAALLSASAWRLASFWSVSQTPLSPLVASVRATDDRPLRAVVPVHSLKLTDRRLLARLAGRRRHFELEVEGYLFVPRAGAYRFTASCDDGCELRLDGRSLLDGSGALSRTVELEPGPRRLELHYRQDAGPGYLVLAWETPSLLEVLPIEAYLASDATDFDGAGPRYSVLTPWAMLLLGLAWVAAASFLAVLGAESVSAWGKGLQRWWRRPPSEAPVSLVRPIAWVGAGTVLLGLGLAARAALPARLAALGEEYAVNPRRAPFVLGRVETFPDYLFFLAALSLVVAILLRLLPSPGREHRTNRRWTGWLLAAIGVSLLWGGYVSEDEWIRYGRPCYDGYCEYADYVRAVMLSPGTRAWSALSDHLARNYHANSPVGPILIAATSLSGPSTVAAYRLLSAAATLGTLLLLVLLGRRELGLGATPALVAGFLFVATGAVQRSFLFPQTDALAMFFFTVAIERLLALRREFSAGGGLLASLAVAVALLTKLSALPLAAIAFLLLAWPKEEQRGTTLSSLVRGGLRATAVVLPPLVLVLAYVLALRTSNNVRTELHRIETLDSRLSFHLVATLVTLLPFFLAIGLTLKRKWAPRELLLSVAVGVYLVGLWTSGASGWERFYLNAMPMALPLAVARLEPLPELRSPPHVALLALAYTVAQGVRMLLHLYNGA